MRKHKLAPLLAFMLLTQPTLSLAIACAASDFGTAHLDVAAELDNKTPEIDLNLRVTPSIYLSRGYVGPKKNAHDCLFSIDEISCKLSCMASPSAITTQPLHPYGSAQKAELEEVAVDAALSKISPLHRPPRNCYPTIAPGTQGVLEQSAPVHREKNTGLRVI